jgi:NAD(P)-dependent dehydrogenase (short-subunit alcohol dehydrogenase family)
MTETVVIAGVGPGLGESVARKFASEGCNVGLFARSEEYIEELAADLDSEGAGLAVPADLTDESEIVEGFASVREAFGPVDILVNHASAASWTGLLDQELNAFERALDTGPRAALLCSQEAVGDMLDGNGGTVVFTGATTAVRGNDGAIGFSAAKFASRGMAESMARELGPKGIHVAHVVIDGGILTPNAREQYGENEREGFLDPDAIAESYWHLTEQDRSAWTLELDLRPHVEEF